MLKRGVIIAALLALATTASAQDRQPPYWASIASGQAMMRTGPGRNYPGVWLYQRRDLPVKVVQVYPNWRKVVDPDGEQGWMLVSLLSSRRTAMVRGVEPQPMRTLPEAAAPIRFRAEPGVVGRIADCNGQWCHFQVGKREGFIEQATLVGLEPGERVD